MSTDNVEQRLSQLRHTVQWPGPIDVSQTVVAVVSSSGTGKRDSTWRGSRWVRQVARPALAVAVPVALMALILLVSPGARRAVASWLGIPGIDVRVQDEVRVPPPASFRLGEAVTLEEAQRRVDFPIRRLPLHGELHRTGGGVYLDDSSGGGIVHILYAQQQGLPYAFPKGVGALLTQFRTPADGSLFIKEALRTDSQVTPTTVGGEPALWVSGPSHVLIPNRDGVPERDEARLAANALLWSASGVTYRLETSLSLRDAVALAESLL